MTNSPSQSALDLNRAQVLIDDAELVADVAVRLGRLQTSKLISDIAALKIAASSGTNDLDLVAALQTSLNTAVKDIAPITLRDLRSGWNPGVSKPNSWPIVSFGLFAIFLICITAYMTLLYNRVSFAHASLVEIQSARVSEQVMKLFDTLRSNEQEMVAAFRDGKPRDLRLDSFYKSYFDLKNTDEKLIAMIEESFALTAEGAVPARFVEAITWVAQKFSSSTAAANASTRENTERIIKEREQIYTTQSPFQSSKFVVNPEGNQMNAGSEKGDQLAEVLQLLFDRAIGFTRIASLPSMNPLKPIPIYGAILKLHDIMNILGLWYLPALYGMLGSSVFHMRRFLDPNIPNPSSIRTAYRIFLGAFAGIVVVWFWAPAPQKGGEQVLSTLSSFSIAFLVGFSIDIFFQALDRLVTKVSQAIG
jgi:hypothetical protein